MPHAYKNCSEIVYFIVLKSILAFFVENQIYVLHYLFFFPFEEVIYNCFSSTYEVVLISFVAFLVLNNSSDFWFLVTIFKIRYHGNQFYA